MHGFCVQQPRNGGSVPSHEYHKEELLAAHSCTGILSYASGSKAIGRMPASVQRPSATVAGSKEQQPRNAVALLA
ncbi:hypothetical protein HC256_001526 [Beauveria bassiana]|nr:hypothetical protein HC256_001526 [Beauveria bassiana]